MYLFIYIYIYVPSAEYTMCWYLLLAVALIFTSIGGWMDIQGAEEMSFNTWRITKHHFWHDGLIIAILALFLYLRQNLLKDKSLDIR